MGIKSENASFRAAPVGVVFLFGLISAMTLADDPASPAEARVVIRTIDGEDIVGDFLSMTPAAVTVEIGADRQLKTLEVADIVRLTHDRQRATSGAPDGVGLPMAARIRLELVGGGILFGEPQGGKSEAVEIGNAALGTLTIPLAQIRRWVSLPPRIRGTQSAEFYEPAPLRNSAPGGLETDDRVLLTNGDVLSGIITAIDDSAFTLLVDGDQETLIPHERVAMAAVISGPPIATTQPAMELRLIDGSTLTVVESTLDKNKELSARTEYGDLQPVPWERIDQLSPLGGRWTRLTTLQPISATQQSQSGIAWDARNNRNVLGHDLRVGGRRYLAGLGTHSTSVLVYELKGEFLSFVTWYGMDDESGSLADVDVAIRVDGQVRHSETGVSAGRLIGPIRLDVTGANRLELVVEPGRNGDIQDRFDWIDCGLVRKLP